MQNLNLPGADVRLKTDFLTRADADRLFETLLAQLPWEQRDVVVGGRTFAQPRLTSWHGDAGHYTYSGLTLQANGWTPKLLEIRTAVEAALREAGFGEISFNSCLANGYRGGRRDSIGFHADDEPELGPNPTIASVSLGRARPFVLLPKKGRPGQRTEVRLAHGSLLVMAGACQTNWLHGLEKDPTPQPGDRINLTFRVIRH